MKVVILFFSISMMVSCVRVDTIPNVNPNSFDTIIPHYNKSVDTIVPCDTTRQPIEITATEETWGV